MKSTTNLELHKYSSYASGLYFLTPGVNTLRIQLRDGNIREITHPKISRDFISGTLEDTMTRGYFRRSFITSIEFYHDDKSGLPELSFTRKALGEQLLELQFPAESSIRYRDSGAETEKILVLEIFRGFLVTSSSLHRAIPLAALASVEVECG